MSVESASEWIKLIHQDKELGMRLLSLGEDDWSQYQDIVTEKGFTFSREELNEAWGRHFGPPKRRTLWRWPWEPKPEPKGPTAVLGVLG